MITIQILRHTDSLGTTYYTIVKDGTVPIGKGKYEFRMEAEKDFEIIKENLIAFGSVTICEVIKSYKYAPVIRAVEEKK